MPGQRDRLHDYIGGVVRGLHGIAHALGGSADHVHIFAGLRSTHCLADGMGEINRGSSQWIHKELGMQGFAWHEGYGGFTV